MKRYLVQVIETFKLQICEDQLMSRCTKCNGRFIQKPLTTEEAVEAAKGFQRIPSCLFDKNLEFWQCMDCGQLYWEVGCISPSICSLICPLLRKSTPCLLHCFPLIYCSSGFGAALTFLLWIKFWQGTQYHNAVQKFIDVCKLNEWYNSRFCFRFCFQYCPLYLDCHPMDIRCAVHRSMLIRTDILCDLSIKWALIHLIFISSACSFCRL